jgi:methylmalonyl-CoA mutase
VHAFAASSALTRLDLPNNLVRTALIGLAAAVGGADAITLPAFDAPGGAPSLVGRRSATTGQHVLAEEATLAQWEDPAAGAGVVEALTAALVDAAWADATAIARRGGLAREIGVGAWAARMAARQAASVEAAVTLARPRVGVSLHPADVEADAAAPVVARAATEAEPAGAVDVEPGASATAEGASAEGATAARCPVPPKLSLDEPFLGLRARMLALAGALGRAPAARVVTVGAGGQARARAEFAAAELAALGFAVVRAGEAELVCLCPTDDALAAGLGEALAEVRAPVIVAAPPSADVRVVGWLHRRADRIGLMHAALDAVTARRAAGAEEAG